ncbi:hypothetical protein RFI_21114, partial [Reticulomyxa filosa]
YKKGTKNNLVLTHKVLKNKTKQKRAGTATMPTDRQNELERVRGRSQHNASPDEEKMTVIISKPVVNKNAETNVSAQSKKQVVPAKEKGTTSLASKNPTTQNIVAENTNKNIPVTVYDMFC